MIVCPACQVSNSIDSQFCKGCGKPLPNDVIGAAQSEHEALVAEGYKALNEGRAEEAQLIAQAALEQFPESVSALSLKGMSQERLGKIAEALESFEKVVELHPHSSLDKIKVQQLRNSLSVHALQVPEPNRRLALVGALAAVLVVVGLGMGFAVFTQRGTALDSGSRFASRNPKLDGISSPNPVLDAPTNDQSAQPKASSEAAPSASNGSVQPIKNNVEGGANASSGVRGGLSIRGNGGGMLPPAGSGVPLEGDLQPWRPPTPPTGEASATNNSSHVPDEPEPTMGNQPSKPQGSAGDPPDDPGIIEIKTSRKGQPSQGGGSDADRGMSLRSLQEAAKHQFQIGQFSQAAQTYERILAMGGDPASVNQRLGQCYANSGQAAKAAGAYRRAISAIEARIKGNPSDSAYLEKQLRSCRDALKVLGG